MQTDELVAHVEHMLDEYAGNRMVVSPPEGGDAEMPIFDTPLVGVADATDSLFERFVDPAVIGPKYRVPEGWLPGARSVVSVFFPFSDQVRDSNRGEGQASLAWQQGKHDGTKVIADICQGICDLLQSEGHRAIAPCRNGGNAYVEIPESVSGKPSFKASSAWSERHAAFVCGLGTFGISKGLITRRGMAGRFGSVVTDAPLQVTPREYEGVYEWCIHCSACVQRCPVNAITPGGQKNNAVCESWCVQVDEVHHLGDACGKCQIEVPCECRRPLSSGS